MEMDSSKQSTLPFPTESLPVDWKISTVGDCCISVNDGDWIETKDQGGGDYRLLQISNVGLGVFRETGNYRYITQATFDRLSCREVLPGQILVARMPDPTGRAWFVTPMDFRAITAVDVAILEPDDAAIDGRYCAYYLNSQYNLRHAKARAGGTTRERITRKDLAGFPLPVPPLPIQRRIAGVLLAYDELIENCHRRIKILESMARALYREWFVHFRFPGHESVPRVPSPLGEIPQGWEVKPLADSFEISGGGTPSRKDARYWEDGTIQWFSPSDLTGAGTMFMDDSGDHITALGLAESSARLFPARSVMLTSRATIGAIAINTREACTNQGFITCLPNERVPLFFLFHWVTENVPTFQRMASGSTFKEISRGVFKTIEFVQPPANLVWRFEDMAAPIAEQALVLQRQIQNLRHTRDLLLPRLLSGQIDVEAIAS
jgi:type I restriction enzyme S subunit